MPLTNEYARRLERPRNGAELMSWLEVKLAARRFGAAYLHMIRSETHSMVSYRLILCIKAMTNYQEKLARYREIRAYSDGLVLK